MVDVVVRTMRAPARSLVDEVMVGGLAGVYTRSAILVSNDTGPRHLAQAVGTATAGIYWCGNVINAGHPTRARRGVHLSWTAQRP